MPASNSPFPVPVLRSEPKTRRLGTDTPALALERGTVLARPERRNFSVYEPLAAFDLIDELEHLTARSIEPLPFYAPQFLVPGMPRLDERQVRLLVARDEGQARSRLRLLMPFSVEATGLFRGPRCVRAWTHPFGPRGTIPIDHDDPAGTIASLFDALAETRPKLPSLLVIPDLALEGPVAKALCAEAERRDLPFEITERRERACLDATADPDAFLGVALSGRRQRELRRLRRRLEAMGEVRFEIAHRQKHVREAVEEFLEVEASGWKGRARSALLTDRYRAAFTREALDGLASCTRVRVYSLKLNERVIASAVVLVTGGQAVLWKIGYDESFAPVSPGFQLLADASDAMLRDPEIRSVDSCAVPDHTLVNRLWRDRIGIGTLVLSLNQNGAGQVARASAGLTRVRTARSTAWRMRNVLKALVRGG